MLMEIHPHLFHVKQCLQKATKKDGKGEIQRKSDTEAEMSANEDIASCGEGGAEEMGEGKLTFLIGEW